MREGSGSSGVVSIFNISFSFIPNPALTRRLFTPFSLGCGHFFATCMYLFADGCMKGGYFPPPASLSASGGPALGLPPSQNPPGMSSGDPCESLMVSKVSAAPPFNTGSERKGSRSPFWVGREARV